MQGMPSWSPPALAAALFIAMHYLLLRAASGRLDDRLGALVLEGSAAAGIALSLLFGVRSADVPTTRAGVGFAAASGLTVAVASVLLFVALRRGGPVASTGTMVLGGGVVVSALLAPVFFGEALTVRRVVGVVLGVAAMGVLATE
jgi:uncharacterized membrane protein